MDAKTIAAKRFERGAFGSYKATDVDVFINEVADYVKKLEKEHDDLLRDLKILADKTEEYRESEDAVQEALVKAQKYGNKIINDAKIEAEEIDSAAKAQAVQIIAEAQEKAYAISNEAMEQTERLIRELKNKALAELNELKQKTAVERKTMEQAKIAASSFKADLFELYRMHLDSINRIPDLSETDYVPETLPELESPQPEEAAETASPEENPADAAAQSALKESEDSETEDPFAQLEETGDSDSAASEETAQSEESSEASKEPEQLKWGAFEQDTKTFEEEPKVQPQQETAGDTTVIPTQKIDGDATPEDVRRTMQNTSKPVYGRKFTDLKFGSGK